MKGLFLGGVMSDSIRSTCHPPLGHLGFGLGAFFVHEAGVIATGTVESPFG